MLVRRSRILKETRKNQTNTSLYHYRKNDAALFCEKEGLNGIVYKRMCGNKLPFEHFEAIINELKQVFESFGYGPEEYLKYINANPNIIEFDLSLLKYNLALLDYAGVLEQSLYLEPNLLYKRINPSELFSIIKWLRFLDGDSKIDLKELSYYLDTLPVEQRLALQEKFSFKNKESLILTRFQSLLVARLKENKGFNKSLK